MGALHADTTGTNMVSRDLYEIGDMLQEGKTKIIRSVRKLKPSGIDELALLVAKDDITAGDGAKHDIIEKKSVYATTTTCNVLRLLKNCHVPVAYMGQYDSRSFLAQHCAMYPYEVVFRREAHGSYLKRYPGVRKHTLFPKLICEFYLKTKGRRWKEHELPCDDPLMEWTEGSDEIVLYHPAKPFMPDDPLLVLKASEVFQSEDEWKSFEAMEAIGRKTFLILEGALRRENRTLVDLKVEFGVSSSGKLLLADVIDNDSWRVLDEYGRYVDKQIYRDGGELCAVEKAYAHMAAITGRFTLPRQRIVLWTGSLKDDVKQLESALEEFNAGFIELSMVSCSVHKSTNTAMRELQTLVHEHPDSVIIAYIGMSNGAGPTLSANTTAPVITVPANYREFKEDVWSSLRAPSDVPVMTVLEPRNAVLAALTILSARNPNIYAILREKIEARM